MATSDRAIAWIQEHLTGRDGEPLELTEWQRRYLSALLG